MVVRRLFVVCPHADDLDCLDVIQDLVDKSVLDIDPARACTGQIADESLEWRGRLVGIGRKNLKEFLGAGLEPRAREFLRVTFRLLRVD